MSREPGAAAKGWILADSDDPLTLSDSLHDLPLLALEERAWLVNPSPAPAKSAGAPASYRAQTVAAVSQG